MFLGQDAMLDIEEIQRGNEAVITKMNEAEQKAASMQELRQQMQEEITMLPLRIGIGGVAMLFAIYWFLIRR